MMTGAEVGFAWASMNRNSIEVDRLYSFVADASRDEFFDGEVWYHALKAFRRCSWVIHFQERQINCFSLD